MGWIGMRSSPSELWDYVSPFETHEYVRRIYCELHGLSQPKADKVGQITAAFAQGRMYFSSAEAAPLGVKPVLLYYGASALLAGLALIRDKKLTQQNWRSAHGLTTAGWQDILYNKEADLLELAIKATPKGTFRHVVENVWQGHVETLYFGRERPSETAPYRHRLGGVNFLDDGSCVTFSDLVSRSRYTGGLYGSATERPRSLLRAIVWMNPKKGPAGVHVTMLPVEVQRASWLFDDARAAGLQMLGSENRPRGAVFPRGDIDRDGKPDLLPVFHFESLGLEGLGQISVCESMPNGDKPSELLKLYLIAYIVGMFARYFPSQWLNVNRGTCSGPDTAMFISAVTAIERNFIREFSAQLAVVNNDPHFFGEHFGFQAQMMGPDWRSGIGGTGSGVPIIGQVTSP